MSSVSRFLLGPAVGQGQHKTFPWYRVLWLTGVDYFSTLGYQPAIAFIAAGALSPIATAFLIVVTLFAALPVYREVARHSYVGQGSIAMLERLLPGWPGKTFVLVLLGFAATDFVITMTLSAADAAQHAVENPLMHGIIGEHQMIVTLVLLAMLAAVFMRGFGEAIGVAIVVAIPYMLLNVIVIARGFLEIARHPDAIDRWQGELALHGSLPQLLLASSLIFPKLALGLSGFETGVSVMPLVSNGTGEAEPLSPGAPPKVRIAGTGRLLAAAALLMSVMLLGSSFVTTLLIPAEAFHEGGAASGRALAYLAHELLGPAFGTIYDLVTIAILWFAGASAMAGLLVLIPRYLPRFGMGPWWTERARPLVIALFAIEVVVTIAFQADVEAQGGAYATGVLVLMLSAAVAVTLALWKSRQRARAIYFGLVALIFLYVTVVNVVERPDGVIIASIFIAAILLLGGISRWWRSTELRVEELSFVDADSERLWAEIRGKKVNLVPLEHTRREERRHKAAELKKHYRMEGAIAFLHVELRDDTSEFETKLKIRVSKFEETGNYILGVSGAVAIANTIAYVSEQIDPLSIFIGLRRANPMSQAFQYLLWGQGEVGIVVYQILVEHWEMTPEDDVRPLIFLFSD